ncbi:hypothetical protein M098_1689 [Phocaeicola vulgatus str. 3775 SR(B) 19]|nr:hypothetical protein M098_1689 [Phocaeicola vulgatus str. 3775 SR(B) 19]
MGSFVNESVTTPCIFWADTEMQHPNNKNSRNDLIYFVFILFTAIFMREQS